MPTSDSTPLNAETLEEAAQLLEEFADALTGKGGLNKMSQRAFTTGTRFGSDAKKMAARLRAARLSPAPAKAEECATCAKLPKTRDGVPIVPGMKVYWHSSARETIEGVEVLSVMDGDADCWSHGEQIGIPLEWACSTRAAADADLASAAAKPSPSEKEKS